MPQVQPNPNELYTAILRSLGYTVTPAGEVYLPLDTEGKANIVYCSNRQLVLPVDDILRRAEWSTKIPFHPLSENTYRGESAIIRLLRNSVILRLTELMSVLLDTLATIGANPDTHKTLATTLKPLPQKIPDADATFLKSLGKILAKSELSGDNMLVHIYLKRGGVIDGTTYSRAAITSFPILKQMEEGGEVFGVALRKKDMITLRGLFDFILAQDDKSLEVLYNHGSTDLYAPYFDALMGAYHKLGSHLSAILYRYRKYVVNLETVQPDWHWYEQMSDLSKYRGVIPVLSDNEGVMIDEQGNAVETAAPAPTVTPFVDPTYAPPPATASVGVPPTQFASTSPAVMPASIAAPPDIHHSSQLPAPVATPAYSDAEFERALLESTQPAMVNPLMARGYTPSYIQGANPQVAVNPYPPQGYGQPYAAPVAPKSYHQAPSAATNQQQQQTFNPPVIPNPYGV